jgi:enolase
LALLVHAIADAGYTPGREGVAIAIDPAASAFNRDGRYAVGGESLSSEDMIDRCAPTIDCPDQGQPNRHHVRNT